MRPFLKTDVMISGLKLLLKLRNDDLLKYLLLPAEVGPFFLTLRPGILQDLPFEKIEGWGWWDLGRVISKEDNDYNVIR